METLTRVCEHRSQLAECPTWHPQEEQLYWTDIQGEQLLRYSPTAGVECLAEDVVVGGFTIQDDGSLLLFMDNGTVGLYRDGTLTQNILSISDVDVRFNDVAADPAGRVFCGTMPGENHPGHLYRLDPDGTFERLIKRVQVPNGIGFAPDFERLYFTETDNRIVHAFDYDRERGTIAGRQTLADFRDSPGKPDGLAVDSTGNVWSAQWGAGVVDCFSADGKHLSQIDVPAQYVTSITFGGPNGHTSYISTAQASDPNVDDGGTMFAFETDVTGVPTQYSQIEV